MKITERRARPCLRPFVLLLLATIGALPVCAQTQNPNAITLPIPTNWTCSSPTPPRPVPVAGLVVVFGPGYSAPVLDANNAIIDYQFADEVGCAGAGYDQMGIAFTEDGNINNAVPVKNVTFRFNGCCTPQVQEGTIGPPVPYGQTNGFIQGPAGGIYIFVTGANIWSAAIDSVTFEKAYPKDVKFDSTATEQVLLHKYRQDDKYLSANQAKDGQITISGTILDPKNNPIPGGSVSLRVLDPPDTSRYIPASQATKNDNLDPADQGGLNSRLSATTVTGDANGHFTVTLTTTSQYGGDNYIVEASADPAFPCATADPTGVDRCASTGTIQAWKRMYVEMDQMYRASALLSDFAFPGDTHIYINDSSLFKAGDSVTLIHAPSYNRSKVWDSAGFYSEANPVSVTKIAANRTTHPGKYDVSLSAPLTQNYYLDGVALGTTTPLGDALVNLSRYADPRKSGSPRFGSDERYVKTAFAEAYLDVLDTPTGGVGVPSYPALSEPAMYWVAEKWWRARTQATYPSNHGVAIAAATNGTEVNSLGTSNTFWSFVFRGTIDTLTAASKHNGTLVAGLDPVKVSGEVLVHELAHQWNVNPNYPKGECSQDSYDSTSSAHYFCQMDSPANTGQYADDHLAFHYVGTAPRTADSEYLIIRMQKEPKQ